MNDLPKKCLVDTNVPKTANLAAKPDPDSDVPPSCIVECIRLIQHVTQKGGLVIDSGSEIFMEYRQNLSLRGQPGVGDIFMKWVHDNQWKPQKIEQVRITSNSETYDEFPKHEWLTGFDKSDRKFISAANAHCDKPPVMQAPIVNGGVLRTPYSNAVYQYIFYIRAISKENLVKR